MKTLRRAATALAIILGGVTAVATPDVVEAMSCTSNAPWASEAEMIAYEGSQMNGCRRTFVSDPGVGELHDPNSISGTKALLTPQRVNFYLQRGFNENFLWYAPRTDIAVGNFDTRQWTGCGVAFPAGSICPQSNVVVGSIGTAFKADASLRIIGYENQAWIALSCGNYWSDGNGNPKNPVPKPVPYIDGIKFHDYDRDGIRDAGEPTISNWTIKITRVSSRVGQPNQTWTLTTDANGAYRFDLDGQGPGRYVVEEVVPSGWQNYTPISEAVDVDFGVDAMHYTVDFGNARTQADVAKTDISIVSAPDHFDAGVASDVTVSVTVENLGPAEQVPVRDELVAVLPDDCTTPDPRRSFTATLRRGQPVTRQFTFSVTCERPSEHEFVFDDVLTITRSDITDINPHNNTASETLVRAVHAYTDLAVAVALTCAPETDVDVAADCDIELTVTNDGFGTVDIPVDATAAAQLELPDDCTATPELATIPFAGLVDGDSVTKPQTFSVVCTHRSFHEINVSAAVVADDPHVFDTDESNNTAGDGPSIMEVFHDATMEVTRVHLVCDEVLGGGPFTCTAEVDYVKTGPAPLVEAVVYAEIDMDECAAAPAARQSNLVVLDDNAATATFMWTMDCLPSDVLHSGCVVADVNPSDDEPHAVDEPHQKSDCWEVPYCLPTVNPHGKKEPQAPGSGQNEDGFYVFGVIPADAGDGVYIRDDASGVEFGPFPDGTRIKWVEANGAEPKITPMGGNNGNGNGQANAVDYQIHAQGDAQAFFIDEEGVEVSVTCLVPPFPK